MAFVDLVRPVRRLRAAQHQLVLCQQALDAALVEYGAARQELDDAIEIQLKPLEAAAVLADPAPVVAGEVTP